MFVTLKPKNRQGEEVVAAHGSVWHVTDEVEKVQFTRRPGPWLLVESSHDRRWVHRRNDKNFLVEPCASDLSPDQAEALRKQLTYCRSAASSPASRKNPFVAAILSFVFGPLGYLYIGWRYAVLAAAVLAIFVFILEAINFPIPAWMKYVILVVFAWKASKIVSVTNELIDAENEDARALNTFPFAAMAMSDLLVGVGMFYAAAIGLYLAARLLLEGGLLRGLLVLLVGTPLLVWIASLVFGLIAMGIDAIFVSKMKNVFRN